jgi:hypothetical protein
VDLLPHPLDVEPAEIGDREVVLHDREGLGREIDRVGRRQLHEARADADRSSLGRVVGSQPVADAADHDVPVLIPIRTRKSKPHSRFNSRAYPRTASRSWSAHQQARCAWSSWEIGAPNSAMIPVTGVLIDRAAKQVHPFTHQPEEAVEDPVPPLRIHLLDDLHRSLHVDEERGDVLALALDEVGAMKQLGDDVMRGVRLRDRVGGSQARVGGA